MTTPRDSDRLPVGVVLAGGAGRRLKRSKGDIVLDGETLAERAARVLAPFCRGVLISIRGGGTNPAPGLPAVEDPPPGGRGPLVGLHAAFEATGDEPDLLVLACDYPRVGTELLAVVAAAAGEADVVLPVDPDGRDHPLVALWSRSAALEVADALHAGNLAVRDTVARLRVRRIEPGEFPEGCGADVLLNLNRPDDLARLEGRGPGRS